MLRPQAVNRNDNVDMLKGTPRWRDLAKCAGDDLHVNATLQQKRHKGFKFAISNERITANQRQVQRLHAIDYIQHSINQSVAFEIREIAQSFGSAQMIVIVSVATGTAQRTLASYFDGKRRGSPAQNELPGTDNVAIAHVPIRQYRGRFISLSNYGARQRAQERLGGSRAHRKRQTRPTAREYLAAAAKTDLTR